MTTAKKNLWKTPLLGPLVFACWKFDAARKLRWMNNWLSYMGRHIEIGSGPGSVLDVMRRQNYRVYGLDIRDTLTKRFDSLMNLEFKGHPHSNRTDKDWLASFERLGLSLRHREIHRVALLFKQAVYVVDQHPNKRFDCVNHAI